MIPLPLHNPWGAAPNPALAVRQAGQAKRCLPRLLRAYPNPRPSRVRLRPSPRPFGARLADTRLCAAAACGLALDRIDLS